jgi:hypothetical protein
MRWSLSEISGYRVHGRDGRVGTVADMYFDDVDWMVRYLVVNGADQSGPRTFLLSPEVICSTDREFGLISVFLRIAAVHNSPVISVNGHITQQDERRLREYYGWPHYEHAVSTSTQTDDVPHLHSLAAVLGHRVLAGEDDIGPLLDFVINDHTWKIHCLEVDASRWLHASRIWIRSDCVKQVNRSTRQIELTIRRKAVLNSPPPDLTVLWPTAHELPAAGTFLVDTPYT